MENSEHKETQLFLPAPDMSRWIVYDKKPYSGDGQPITINPENIDDIFKRLKELFKDELRNSIGQYAIAPMSFEWEIKEEDESGPDFL